MAASSSISWTAVTPTGTTVSIEIALSTDNGATWTNWLPCTNGQAVPGIDELESLQNVQLKTRAVLTTTDVYASPELQEVNIEIITAWADIAHAYGPNKSTLTAWDSISLAWKPERLSLVVNDEEACYIKNPSLPASLGSHIFIGTDRNGNNAINTLVDELRIDKVYREVNIRTGWHKTGVPFYTSEDMKQWPGYLKLETDGIKVYDPNDALRVLLGSWLSGAIRKYGLKIIGGELYSTMIQTGEEGSDSYIYIGSVYENYNYPFMMKLDGKDAFNIMSHSRGPIMNFYDPYYNERVATILPMDDARGQGLRIQALNNSGAASDLHLDGRNVTIDTSGSFYVPSRGTVTITSIYSVSIGAEYNIVLAGDTVVIGEITATGGKPASQPTENYGIRKIYAVESPELKYYDSGVANLQNGEATIYIDPIFLECIEPDTELTPWQIWVECYGENGVYVSEVGPDYFKVKERSGGTSNNKIVWRLEATRKNYAGIRLMEVVD